MKLYKIRNYEHKINSSLTLHDTLYTHEEANNAIFGIKYVECRRTVV